jgi:hypothetical protein
VELAGGVRNGVDKESKSLRKWGNMNSNTNLGFVLLSVSVLFFLFISSPSTVLAPSNLPLILEALRG